MDFIKKFPPPETLYLKFKSVGAEEDAAKLFSELGITAAAKTADADHVHTPEDSYATETVCKQCGLAIVYDETENVWVPADDLGRPIIRSQWASYLKARLAMYKHPVK